MLTVYTSPKPFNGVAAWNQINALRSWRMIHSDVDIWVFGAVAGAKEAATEVNATWVSEHECSQTGAPSFNAMVEHVRRHGRHELQVYVNADILLDSTLLTTMLSASQHFGRFLLVGERMDLGKETALDVRTTGWIDQLPRLAQERRLSAHGPTGMDYFGYRRSIWDTLAPVFMGRGLCDQAILHYCLRHQFQVVDATLSVVCIHQFHGYEHLAGEEREVFAGEDQKAMAVLHGLNYSLPTIADAGSRFTENGAIEANRCRHGRLRRMEMDLRYHHGLRRTAMLMRMMQYLGGKRSVLPRRFATAAILNAWRNFA